MNETEKKLLHEVMLNLITTIDCYCDFIKVFMKQEQNKPDGITVSPHEFQDGFRALNHLTVSLARIERALTETEPTLLND